MLGSTCMKGLFECNLNIFMIFQAADNDAAKQFLAAAEGIDEYPFGLVTDSALASENKASGDVVVVFKKVWIVKKYFYEIRDDLQAMF